MYTYICRSLYQNTHSCCLFDNVIGIQNYICIWISHRTYGNTYTIGKRQGMGILRMESYLLVPNSCTTTREYWMCDNTVYIMI